MLKVRDKVTIINGFFKFVGKIAEIQEIRKDVCGNTFFRARCEGCDWWYNENDVIKSGLYLNEQEVQND
jgi:hypothetical protein